MNRANAARLTNRCPPTRMLSRMTPRTPLRHHRQIVETFGFLPVSLPMNVAAWGIVINGSS
jgi:hypothetical protein